MYKFKTDDRVRMLHNGKWVYGEVTIPRENDSKVLFDYSIETDGLDYTYYPNSDLELADDKSRMHPDKESS